MVRTTLVAVVSSDGKITGPDDDMSSLASAPDQEHLRRQLRTYDLLMFGRKTYEKDCKNMAAFRCVVLTESVSNLEETKPNHWLWNPKILSFKEMCSELKAPTIGVFGGSKVYTLARAHGWLDELLLTYVAGVVLERGTPLFTDHPTKEVWLSLDSGALGFELAEPPKNLPNSDSLPNPPQLRHYKRKR